jgi:hypothetical protein
LVFFLVRVHPESQARRTAPKKKKPRASTPEALSSQLSKSPSSSEEAVDWYDDEGHFHGILRVLTGGEIIPRALLGQGTRLAILISRT